MAEPSAENGLRPDVTPEAVVALRLAADNMPIARPGQQWSGAADWLRRRADAFEVALRDSAIPPVDMCHNGHPFVPGVSSDHAPGEADPRWCNTCGEARVIPPAESNGGVA